MVLTAAAAAVPVVGGRSSTLFWQVLFGCRKNPECAFLIAFKGNHYWDYYSPTQWTDGVEFNLNSEIDEERREGVVNISEPL